MIIMDVIFVTFYALRHDNKFFSFSVSGWFLANGTNCTSTLIHIVTSFSILNRGFMQKLG